MAIRRADTTGRGITCETDASLKDLFYPDDILVQYVYTMLAKSGGLDADNATRIKTAKQAYVRLSYDGDEMHYPVILKSKYLTPT